MPSKFGTIVERLTGAIHYFVPDGSNIGTVEAPIITGKGVKPGTPEKWLDYFTGRINSSKYDPKTAERDREAFSPTLLNYVKQYEKWVETDAFNITQIDYPATLFDQLMFGLETPPVDDVPQTAFATPTRHVDGWSRMVRHNEDKSVLCELEVHVRLTIQEHPEDKNERGSPVLRIEVLGDTDPAMQTIVFNPTP